MIFELEEKDYEKVLPLFKERKDHPVINAIIERNNPGKIWVDDVENPKKALLWAKSEQDFFLAGDANDNEFNRALNKWITEKITPEAIANGESSFSLIVSPETWETKIDIILEDKNHMIGYTNCYTFHFEKFKKHLNWKEKIPPGFTMKEIDEKLFEIVDDGSDVLFKKWWKSFSEFKKKGVGFSLLDGEKVVSTCFACFVGANAVEIGIVTTPEYQRRGFALLTAAAFIERCLEKNLRPDWHTSKYNIPSHKLAEKLGYEKIGEITSYYFMYDEFENLMENAIFAMFDLKDYPRATIYFQEAFKKGEPSTVHYYYYSRLLALTGKIDDAFEMLHKTIDKGLSDPKFFLEHMKKTEDLACLRKDNRWQEVISRIEKIIKGEKD